MKSHSPRGAVALPLSVALLIALALFGGSSRASEPLQIPAQLAAVLLGAVALAVPRGAPAEHLRAVRLLLLALLAGCVAQLIPLPPGLWRALPGRELFARHDDLVGLAGHWRPISLSPDATIGAALGLVPPLALLALLGGVERARWPLLFWIVAALIVASAGLGVLQVASGSDALYHYRVTNRGVATGLFANRNHQALFLAMAFPLAPFLMERSRRRGMSDLVVWGATAAALLLAFVAMLATGSRSGLLLLVMAVPIALGVARVAGRGTAGADRRTPARPREKLLVAGLVLGVVLLAGGLALAGDWTTLARFRALDVASDQRASALVPNLALLWRYFPIGIGAGAFPQVYRITEARGELDLSYFNHAHNDWLEVVMEFGLLAPLVLGALAVWLARTAVRALRASDATMRAAAAVALGWSALVAVSSVFDYPLRAPLMASLFVLALATLASAASPVRRGAGGANGAGARGAMTV